MGVPKRTLTLMAGATDRRKTVLVSGDPAALAGRLETWLAGRLARLRRTMEPRKE